jgi:hypothetical protein
VEITLADVMETHVIEVIGQRDAARRRIAMRAVYAEDCLCVEEDAEFAGFDVIDERAEGILELGPGWVLRPTRAAEVVNGIGLVRWGFGPPGAAPVITGLDVAIFQRGKIRTLYSFVDRRSLTAFLDHLSTARLFRAA